MANELVHASVGTALSQAEWEDVNGHVFNNSTQGDVPYVSSSGAIKRLAAGTSGYLLQTLGAGANPTWGPVGTTWAPTVTQGVAVGCTVNYAKYWRLGPIVVLSATLTITAAGTTGQPVIVGNIPSAAAPNSGLYGDGIARIGKSGVGNYVVVTEPTSSSMLQFVSNLAVDYFGVNPSTGLANNDTIRFTFSYETV